MSIFLLATTVQIVTDCIHVLLNWTHMFKLIKNVKLFP